MSSDQCKYWVSNQEIVRYITRSVERCSHAQATRSSFNFNIIFTFQLVCFPRTAFLEPQNVKKKKKSEQNVNFSSRHGERVENASPHHIETWWSFVFTSAFAFDGP